MTAADLARLHADCFRQPRPWTEGEFAALLDGCGVILLAEEGAFLLGRVVADETELLTLAVSPAQRRRGIATRLVSRFIAEARARGGVTIFLEVAADNLPAIALYSGQGFTESGRRRGYYATPEGNPVDALVMSRLLSRPAQGS
ncbi:Ribosomal-protein-alanine acetyltransferase [Defluviimonas aquaemixtae]|uniref:Ribosomal-protein-alanine acetyltransferase n=1 Tax=Albidovulum aquaemixtae TaxID=1542388 RepID=A0A2R8BME0_9RHOB|nr:GNAT family N-acetyltransferase [Defluviimonas aquaemixtae]SPH24576.1 Ribosomal-protein-alanine acetyltransferase [Defluviimonas aquaemixtae]